MQTFLHDYNFEEPGDDEFVYAFWERFATLQLPSKDR
jgi:hypothetical protein